MKKTKTYLYPLLRKMSLLTTLFVLSSVASAALIEYEGYAEIEFILVSVNHTQGNGEGPGSGLINNAILSAGSISETNVVTSGSGTAAVENNLISSIDWTIDSNLQYSSSTGKAGLTTGSSDAFSDTDFSIAVTNKSGAALAFEFSYAAYVSAELIFGGPLGVSDDGGAYGEIFMADSYNEKLLFASAEAYVGGPESDSEFVDDTLIFTLQDGESNTIFGTVYSEGYAEAVAVPEPSTLYLLSMGLLGLAGVNRRQLFSNDKKVT